MKKILYKDDQASRPEASLGVSSPKGAIARVESLDRQKIANKLNESSNALLKEILSSQECEALAGLYGSDEHFRSRVVMARHGFGRGEYKYFKYPLPDVLQGLRTTLYE